MYDNSEQAERAVELAEEALRAGEYGKAERLARRADKLMSSDRSKELLERLERLKAEGDGGANGNGNGGSTPPPSADATRQRRATPKPEAEYTSSQLEAVKQVKKCKNYYEILGVNKEATDSDIKKAYKKLALSLHPDKNKAPGADAAFKMVGSAAATLLDAEKRKQYDLFGSEEEVRGPAARRSAHQPFAGYTAFEQDFSAEEFFSMFFNTSSAHVYTRRPGTTFRREAAYPTREAQGNYATVLQMVPILGLILLSMMSTLFIQDPIYSLNPSHKFPIMRKTENLHVPYYVKENFHNEYQGSLRRLEMTVEEDYVTNLRIACQRERSYRDNLAWKSRQVDSKQFQSVNNMKMPSCEALNNLQR